MTTAKYYKPQSDITTQELAQLVGFFSMSLIEAIQQRTEEITNRQLLNYLPLRIADRSLDKTKTIILAGDIYDSLPVNLKRHFTS